MTSLSPNYSLVLYDSVTDASELFADFRNDIAGTSASNMLIIDTALDSLQTQIDAIIGAVKVDALYASGSLYTATGISGITTYENDLQIILSLDQTSNGSVTLNINSLGVKTVYKIDNAGNVRNIDGNELGKNKEYYLRYNGTGGYWIVVSAIQNTGVLRKNTEALATTKTLTDYDEQIQYLDPNGSSRDVLLPAEGLYNPVFAIYNSADADEDLLVKEDSATTIIATLTQGQAGYFFSDGTSWIGFSFDVSFTQGDIKYAVSETETGSLPIGTAGFWMKVNAGGTAPEWSALPVASTSVSGIVPLAVTADINTGTNTTDAITPDALAGSNLGTKGGIWQLIDPTTDVDTGIKVEFTVPDCWNGMNLIRAQGRVTTAGTTGSQVISVERFRGSWVDMLSTNITIASGGYSNEGTVNTSNDDIQTDDLIRITIDTIHTTPAKGTSVVLEFRLP